MCDSPFMCRGCACGTGGHEQLITRDTGDQRAKSSDRLQRHGPYAHVLAIAAPSTWYCCVSGSNLGFTAGFTPKAYVVDDAATSGSASGSAEWIDGYGSVSAYTLRHDHTMDLAWGTDTIYLSETSAVCQLLVDARCVARVDGGAARE